jgi:hypothetical protein
MEPERATTIKKMLLSLEGEGSVRELMSMLAAPA